MYVKYECSCNCECGKCASFQTTAFILQEQRSADFKLEFLYLLNLLFLLALSAPFLVINNYGPSLQFMTNIYTVNSTNSFKYQPLSLLPKVAIPFVFKIAIMSNI